MADVDRDQSQPGDRYPFVGGITRGSVTVFRYRQPTSYYLEARPGGSSASGVPAHVDVLAYMSSPYRCMKSCVQKVDDPPSTNHVIGIR